MKKLAVKKLRDDLTIIKELGSGASAVVYECEYRKLSFTKKVAVKLFKTDFSSQKGHKIFEEANILANISHKNIAQVLDVDKTDKNEPFIIYELIEGSTLDQKIKNNEIRSESEAFKYYKQIREGLEFIHSRNLIHRDIKPSNIIVPTDGTIKIIDFGVAADFEDSNNDLNFSGTISYCDPDIVNNSKAQSVESDIFAANLVLFEMITGNKLFQASNILEQIESLKEYDGVEEIDLEEIQAEKIVKLLSNNLLPSPIDRDPQLYLSINIRNEDLIDQTVQNVKVKRNLKKKNTKKIVYLSIFFLAATIGIIFTFQWEIKRELWEYYSKDIHIKRGNKIKKLTLDQGFKSRTDIDPAWDQRVCNYYLTRVLLPLGKYLIKRDKKNAAKALFRIHKAYPMTIYFGIYCKDAFYKKISDGLNNMNKEHRNEFPNKELSGKQTDTEYITKYLDSYFKKKGVINILSILTSDKVYGDFESINKIKTKVNLKHTIHDLFHIEFLDDQIPLNQNCELIGDIMHADMLYKFYVDKYLEEIAEQYEKKFQNVELFFTEKKDQFNLIGRKDGRPFLETASDQFQFCYKRMDRNNFYTYFYNGSVEL